LHAPYKSGLATYLTQNPAMYFLSTTLREELSLTGNVDADDCYNFALELLPREKWDQPIATLSLGQQKLIGVVISLMHKCRIAVLDEPRAFLDGHASVRVRDLISSAAKQDRIVLTVQSPRHILETHNVNTCLRVVAPHVEEAQPILPRVALRADLPAAGEVVFRTEGVSYKYKGKRAFCLSDINLDICEGETVGLTGDNGAGKTTLQLVLSGLFKPAMGSMWLRGERVSRSELLRRVKCCFQNPDDQLFAGTVEEEIGFGLRNMGFAMEEVRTRAAQQLTGLSFSGGDDPFALSYGQQKYLTILATYLLEPDVLILDEPTAGLDESHRNKLFELIGMYSSAGGSTFIISHDGDLIRTACHRTYELRNGRIVAENRRPNETE
ncbi:MAG: ATP-binding cassette domain-containing protein, partial [Candidatus Thorarchaeota archaeon]